MRKYFCLLVLLALGLSALASADDNSDISSQIAPMNFNCTSLGHSKLSLSVQASVNSNEDNQFTYTLGNEIPVVIKTQPNSQDQAYTVSDLQDGFFYFHATSVSNSRALSFSADQAGNSLFKKGSYAIGRYEIASTVDGTVLADGVISCTISQ